MLNVLYVFLIIFGTIIALYVGKLIYVGIRGVQTAGYLHKFKQIYYEHETWKGKEVALTKAFTVFATCPVLGHLTSSEIENALEIIKDAPFPVIFIERIIMKINGQNLYNAFRDTTFLRALVNASIQEDK